MEECGQQCGEGCVAVSLFLTKECWLYSSLSGEEMYDEQSVLCARDLDFGAKLRRGSVTWAVRLKNRGGPRCCTTPSSKKEGEPLASLVLMALIRDLRSRLFRWAFCECR